MVGFLAFWVFGSAALVLGAGAGSFGPLACLVVLCFSVPTTLRLRRARAFKSSKPLLQDVAQLFSTALLFVLISWAAVTWLGRYRPAYWAGVGLSVLMGL